MLSQLAELEADMVGDKNKMHDQPSDSDILQQALVNSGLSGKDQPTLQGETICHYTIHFPAQILHMEICENYPPSPVYKCETLSQKNLGMCCVGQIVTKIVLFSLSRHVIMRSYY